MEETIQPLDVVQQLKPNKYLVIGIASSFILHLICAFILIGLPAGSPPPSRSVTYVDLNATQQPAPVAVPPKQTAPVAVNPELPVLPGPETPSQAPQPVAQPAQPTQPPAPQETKVEEQRSHTIMGLGLTKGYFKTLGEGETLRAGVKEYYLDMLQVINEKWWMDQQIDKRHLAPVIINITLARNGMIVDSRILQGSGNSRYDKAVLAALTAASPLPPLPASFDGDFFQAPIRLIPPLNLMAW